MAKEKQAVTAFIDKVPAFSSTVTKVIQLVNDPRSEPKDLIQTISLDPVLTGKVLKLINSAYFALQDKVVSLNRAVVMLGLNTIKNIALSSSLISGIKMREDFKWFTPDEFWEHSLGCAVGSKAMAAKLGVNPQVREEYFVAGLLHDIGKIILVQYAKDDYEKVLDPEYKPGVKKTDLEVSVFGINHAELGFLMAEKWELPDLLKGTIRGHHSLENPGDEYDRIRAAVHVSDYVCNKKQVGIKSNVDTAKLSTRSLELLGLEKSEIRSVYGDLEARVEKARVFLRQ